MSELYQLIDKVSKKTVDTLGVLKSTPAIVRGKTGNKYNVEMLSNGSVYTVMNLSGCRLVEGQLCQIYYKGELSQRNCYIGAASTSGEEISANTGYVYGINSLGALSNVGKIISSVRFEAKTNTTAIISYTTEIEGSGLSGFMISVDGNYLPKIVRHESINETTETISFSCPIEIETGVHQIDIHGVGNGIINSTTSYVYGHNISKETPQHTDENDYIFTVSNGLTTVTGYIGNSMYPEIPNRLGSGVTTIIDDSAFTDSEITAVYIPEGVTEIR